MFTAIMLTRLLANLWLARARPAEPSDLIHEDRCASYPREFACRSCATTGWRWPLSVVLFVASGVLLFAVGPNFGIDFRGGTLIEIRTAEPPDLASLRGELNAPGALAACPSRSSARRTTFSSVCRWCPAARPPSRRLVDTVQSALGDMFPGIEYRRVEFVGPQISGELIEKGTQAVLVALVLMMIYIWFRFRVAVRRRRRHRPAP